MKKDVLCVVRLATAKDIANIRLIEDKTPGSLSKETDLLKRIFNSECYVAVEGFEIIGYAFITQKFYDYAFLEFICVKEEFRRNRVGTEIINYLKFNISKRKIYTSVRDNDAIMRKFLGKNYFALCGSIGGLNDLEDEVFFAFTKK